MESLPLVKSVTIPVNAKNPFIEATFDVFISEAEEAEIAIFPNL